MSRVAFQESQARIRRKFRIHINLRRKPGSPNFCRKRNDYGLESAKPDLQSTFNDYGLESAKPDLQSTFKKPGGDTAAP